MTDAIRFGTLAKNEFSNVVMLKRNGNGGKYDVLEDHEGNDYQVPDGSTLLIGKIDYCCSTAGEDFRIIYGDNAVTNSTTAPTNDVKITKNITVQTADREFEIEIFGIVPENKYPHLKSSANQVRVQVFGFLI